MIKSGNFYNWNLVGYLTTPTLHKVIALNNVITHHMSATDSGEIIEFGTYKASKLALISGIIGPKEKLCIYGVDDFKGYKSGILANYDYSLSSLQKRLVKYKIKVISSINKNKIMMVERDCETFMKDNLLFFRIIIIDFFPSRSSMFLEKCFDCLVQNGCIVIEGFSEKIDIEYYNYVKSFIEEYKMQKEDIFPFAIKLTKNV